MFRSHFIRLQYIIRRFWYFVHSLYIYKFSSTNFQVTAYPLLSTKRNTKMKKLHRPAQQGRLHELYRMLKQKRIILNRTIHRLWSASLNTAAAEPARRGRSPSTGHNYWSIRSEWNYCAAHTRVGRVCWNTDDLPMVFSHSFLHWTHQQSRKRGKEPLVGSELGILIDYLALR